MNTYYWNTEYPHSNNMHSMSDWLDNHNTNIDIIYIDGTYAEGICQDGYHWAIRASGNGDFNHHKVEFELLEV